MSLEVVEIMLETAQQQCALWSRRRTGSGQPESEADARRRGSAAFGHHALRQDSGGLEIRYVIHQSQRLERSVGPRLAHHARLASRGIERHHGRWRHGALPECVQAAPVEALTGVLLIILGA